MKKLKYVLETKDLTKKIKGKIIVNDINIKVKKGEIYGLLGINGAGKTTTMSMITQLSQKTSGEIKIFGENIENNKKLYKKVGTIIEAPGFYGNLTGYENLKYFASLNGFNDSKMIIHALVTMNLQEEMMTKKVKNYSLGMKQRLALAEAIMNKPELLILDEPINGLDPMGISEIRGYIKKLSKEEGITILISSHILSEIEQLVDTIGIIHNGQLIEEMSMDKVHEKTEKYTLFEVSNLEEASDILKYEFNISSEKIDNKYLKISCSNKNVIINNEFIKNNIAVNQIRTSQDNLEEYFSKLIGAE